ncbi:MAG TPA: bifunctional adenosylcobinamide kinase/adenosylcobinamide-phosphate guanylyltransferase [Candidatus Fusicatenibacter intestinigallinarum]|uniref:Adenosylcobinamide kinase n=1 Tax=Candidatus Fusicatenibacter intestinigallinarum TaxID=2838598 RepID=A0A9D2NCU4_9FIRM|nr:bifunctional adenosylcobinamide kinase/adenosylcobinamide-phosphate guanylyltransferase [Candidatus Fusicatenibacter intestinigallinarum]
MMHLITGGSGSGKSAYAEAQILALNGECRVYLATMYPYDEESRQRIARHRKMRAEKNFTTVECYRDLEKTEIPEHADVLLECMSNLTANEMFWPEGAGSDTEEQILRGVEWLRRKARNLVIVSNEIFSDGCEYDSGTKEYQRTLGKINCRLAELADRVTEVVYGIPLEVKG